MEIRTFKSQCVSLFQTLTLFGFPCFFPYTIFLFFLVFVLTFPRLLRVRCKSAWPKQIPVSFGLFPCFLKKKREERLWTIRGHYPIKQGSWGKSHQKVHPKVRQNLCRTSSLGYLFCSWVNRVISVHSIPEVYVLLFWRPFFHASGRLTCIQWRCWFMSTLPSSGSGVYAMPLEIITWSIPGNTLCKQICITFSFIVDSPNIFR